MKSTEVRIKNLVEFEGKVYEIHTIAEEFPTLNTSEFGIGVVDWNNIKPIPISEEWLLKVGFDYKKYSNQLEMFHGAFYFLAVFSNIKKGTFLHLNLNNQNTSVKYIHQLQNLFQSLRGEELTLEENLKSE